MNSFLQHLQSTWYKNKVSLRNALSFAEQTCVDFNTAPEVISFYSADTHFWSIPAMLDEHRVIFGGWNHTISCFHVEMQQLEWKFQTNGPVYSSPAVLSDGSFVIGSEDFILRRITSEGKLLWTFQGNQQFHGSPTVIEKEQIVFAGNYDHHMYALNLVTGGLLWKIAMNDFEIDDVYSSPALTNHQQIIYGTSHDIVCVGFDGHLDWTCRVGGCVESTAALDYKYQIGVIGSEDRNVYGLSMKHGNVIWKFDTGANVVCSPALNQDSIVCVGSENGILWGLHVSSGQVLWKQSSVGAMRYSAINTLPSGHFLVTSNRETLICLDCKTGSLIWELAFPKGVHSSPFVSPSGLGAIGSNDGDVYFFQFHKF